MAIIPAAAVLLLGLAACGPGSPEPTDSGTPSGSPTGSSDPSTSTDPTTPPAPAVVVPGCEAMISLADAKSLLGDATEFWGEEPVADFVGGIEAPGVPAQLAGADDGRHCVWAVPDSEGAFSLVVAVGADRAAVEAALPAAGFSAVTMGTVTGYDQEVEGMIMTSAQTHLVTGDVWIIADGGSSSLTGQVAGLALDTLRSANPGLGL